VEIPTNNLPDSEDTKKDFREYWGINNLDTPDVYKKGFSQFPNLIFCYLNELGIGGSKSTLAILLLYLISRDFKRVGHCYPGHSQMANDLGTSPGTIGRNLRSLHQLGLIEIGRRISEKGQTTNLYSWQGLMRKLRQLMLRDSLIKDDGNMDEEK